MSPTITGKTSWFGGPNDKENTGTALGLPDTARGIAVYNQQTLGGYWQVKWPNGKVTVERQIDIGPAPWTNRKIDFTSTAIKNAGYTEANFPTDATATITYLGKNPSVAQRQTQQQTQPQANPLMANLDRILSPLPKTGGSLVSFPKPPAPKAQPARTPATGTSTAAAPTQRGVANFDGSPVAAWIKPILDYARQKGWKGGVNSGYRSYADQVRIYNSGVRPAARPGTSNHEFTAFPGGAVDVSDAQTLSNILQNSPYRDVLVWAGSKDPVHFSHPHNGSY
jgi:hypothetical protein